MTQQTNHRRRRRNGNGRGAGRWHRGLGLAAMVLVLVLAVTGILLNHPGWLGLDKRYIQSPAILSLYNIEPPGEPVAYRAGDNWIVQAGSRLFFNRRPVLSDVSEFHGALSYRDMIVIAADASLLLLSGDGRLIESMPLGLGPVSAIGRPAGPGEPPPLIHAGNRIYTADPELINWRSATIDGRQVAWSRPAKPPRQLQAALADENYRHSITWERFLLDLHSGRILGRLGLALMDATALIMITLSLTGAWLWLRRRRRNSD